MGAVHLSRLGLTPPLITHQQAVSQLNASVPALIAQAGPGNPALCTIGFHLPANTVKYVFY